MNNKIDSLDFKIKKISGVASAIIIFSGVGVSIFLSSWFDWNVNHLSDLGMTGKDSAVFFNSSLVLGGFSSLIFSIMLFKKASHVINHLGCIVLSCSTISLIMVGVFNLPHFFHFETALIFFYFITACFLSNWHWIVT